MKRPTNRARAVRPEAEALEARQLLYSTLGGQWAHGSRITYSFAPDGTSVGGVSSAWYQRMSALGISESTWKDQFRKAAATWAVYADINLVEVPDSGAAFSVSGDQQGDPDFGDIRIAGTPQSGGVLGLAFLPPAFNGGTLAGDIVLNTNLTWAVNSGNDLLSVALHEFGHSLGLAHSSTYDAVMYSYYTAIKQWPHADDIDGIRAVYGARQHDSYDAGAGNNVYTTASVITGLTDANKQIALSSLDITAATDLDWFYVAAPTGSSGTMTVRMQSTGLSSLSPRVTLMNASRQTIAAAGVTNAYGATVSVSTSYTSGQGFYIRAQAANSGATGVGAYGLLVNFGTQAQNPINPPNTTVAEQPNNGGGSINLDVLRVLMDRLRAELGSTRLALLLGPAMDDLFGHRAEEVSLGTLSGFAETLRLDPSATDRASWGRLAGARFHAESDGSGWMVVTPDAGPVDAPRRRTPGGARSPRN